MSITFQKFTVYLDIEDEYLLKFRYNSNLLHKTKDTLVGVFFQTQILNYNSLFNHSGLDRC